MSKRDQILRDMRDLAAEAKSATGVVQMKAAKGKCLAGAAVRFYAQPVAAIVEGLCDEMLRLRGCLNAIAGNAVGTPERVVDYARRALDNGSL